MSSNTLARNQMLQQNYNMDVGELNDLIADEQEEWDMEDQEMEEAQVRDKKSFYASKGQSRTRSSYEVKLKRMKNKKK